MNQWLPAKDPYSDGSCCARAHQRSSSHGAGCITWQAARPRPDDCARARLSGVRLRWTSADLDRAGKPINGVSNVIRRSRHEQPGATWRAHVQPVVERASKHRSTMPARLSVDHRQLDAASQALIANTEHPGKVASWCIASSNGNASSPAPAIRSSCCSISRIRSPAAQDTA